MARNIVLIGPMASGKSTVGSALARRLSRPHLDTDHFFVARHGAIPDFFLTHGEPAFRAAEEKIVAELLDSPRPSVVSLGGGAVLSASTRQLLEKCFVVFLDVTEAQARLRIGNAVTRPVLTSEENISPIERWKQIYAQREPLYRQCVDLVVSSAEDTVDARVDTIVQQMPSRRA